MNAEFQRIARRNKKAFLNEQGKEVEENNRKGTIYPTDCRVPENSKEK